MITSVDNAILKISGNHDPRYLVYALNLPSRLAWIESLAQVGGGHRWRISRSKLGELRLPAPPLAEQRAIADSLDQRTGFFKATNTATRRQISRLREYRQALITAAVTGQIEVGEEDAA